MNQMTVQEAEEMTGLNRRTLYNLMETGQADLGVVIRSRNRNTYIFYRPKVERFVNDWNWHTEKLINSVNAMSQILTMVLHQLPGGDEALRGMQNDI